MPKKYYKVVSGDMKSVFISRVKTYMVLDHTPQDIKLRERWCIDYKENEWVSPRESGTALMVFKSLPLAKDWILYHAWFGAASYHNKIYTCQVKNPRKMGFFSKIFTSNRLNSMKKLLRSKKKYLYKCDSPPAGTVFVSAVKLLECVKEYGI